MEPAVELYSGGAYRTGDLDFVGRLGEESERQLKTVGFQRQGRHWIHEEHQVFLEFPSADLDEGDRAAIIEVGEYSVLIIGNQRSMPSTHCGSERARLSTWI